VHKPTPHQPLERQSTRRSIADRRLRERTLSPGTLWRRYSGVLLTLLAVLFTELAFPTPLRISQPTALLLVVVVYTIATGRLLAGMTSALIAIAYEVYFSLAHGDELGYTLMSIAILILAVPATSMIVMKLRERVELAWEERKRLLRKQAQAQAHALALESANQRMDEFLGIASHELRTPLASIKLAIQLTQRKLRAMPVAAGTASAGVAGEVYDGELEDSVRAAQELLAKADGQIGRLDRLVRDLLDVSRIQSGNLEIRTEPRDLTELVGEVIESYRLIAPERLILDELPAGTIMASIDGDRIREVIENLLNNALRYAPQGAITVALRASGGEATVEVRDEGPGLTPKERARIWGRFQRAERHERYERSSAGDAAGGGGLGLGLYLSREILLRHGGRIGVESAPGAGSTFWFTMRCVPAEAPVLSAPSAHAMAHTEHTGM
jgi:signal transduction histidine kinase